MAGHSQFKNIMHRKGAQDAKRAKLFTKIQREITSAAKTGMPDPASNPRLRSAIQWAREENMPRDKIDSAVKRASGGADTANYEAIRYEGYGPGGTALIIRALTDNRNRAASEVRSAFTKFGGNLGETGSVSFMFDNVGMIIYPIAVAGEEQIFEAAIEAGADGCESSAEGHTLTCQPEQFGQVRDALEQRFGEPISAKLTWHPKSTVTVDEEHAQALLKLIDALEDSDDVQEVFCNFQIPEALMRRLSA